MRHHDGLAATVGAVGEQFERRPAIGCEGAAARRLTRRHELALATNVSEFFGSLEQLTLAALPLFVGR
jgi:hypothetical protein